MSGYPPDCFARPVSTLVHDRALLGAQLEPIDIFAPNCSQSLKSYLDCHYLIAIWQIFHHIFIKRFNAALKNFLLVQHRHDYIDTWINYRPKQRRARIGFYESRPSQWLGCGYCFHASHYIQAFCKNALKINQTISNQH